MIYVLFAAFIAVVGSLVFYGFKSKKEYLVKKNQQLEHQMIEKELRDRQEKLEREREISELVEKKMKLTGHGHGAREQNEKSDFSKILGGKGQGVGHN